MSQLKEGKPSLDLEDSEPTPSGRNPNEKLQLLLESKQLSDEHLGEWLRQHGLYTEHLTLWQQELEGIVTDKLYLSPIHLDKLTSNLEKPMEDPHQ